MVFGMTELDYMKHNVPLYCRSPGGATRAAQRTDLEAANAEEEDALEGFDYERCRPI